MSYHSASVAGPGCLGNLPKGVSAEQLEEVRLFNASLTLAKANSRPGRRQRGSGRTSGAGAGRVAVSSCSANSRGAYRGDSTNGKSGRANRYEYDRLTPYSSFPSPITKKSNAPMRHSPLRQTSTFNSGPTVGAFSGSRREYRGQYQNGDRFSGSLGRLSNEARGVYDQLDPQWSSPDVRQYPPLQIAAQLSQEADRPYGGQSNHGVRTATADSTPTMYHLGSPTDALPGLRNSTWNPQPENSNPAAGRTTHIWNRHSEEMKLAPDVSTSPWSPQLHSETANCFDPFATPPPNYMETPMEIDYCGPTSADAAYLPKHELSLVEMGFSFESPGNHHLLDFEIGDACLVEPLRPIKPSEYVPTQPSTYTETSAVSFQAKSPPTLKDSRWAPKHSSSTGVAPCLFAGPLMQSTPSGPPALVTTFPRTSAPPVAQVSRVTTRWEPPIFSQSSGNIPRTTISKPNLAPAKQKLETKVAYLKDSRWAD